ncbi:MAG TPA: replication-relaxation family protein [Solirubrobacterales bacterium]|nr:replication-relaxation family protein [Solirubrobacterales bacterium]
MTPRRQGWLSAPLSDLDHRILALLSRHRVLTQNQLATIVPEVPTRTLRYRSARLASHGLVGRSRPYRERGSAPHHLWPTRKGEALASGGPPPRGGERREPNPHFLAHAAGLTEVYVALETALPVGAALARFEREGEAREPFVAEGRRERAIAPDALIEIADADGRPLLAFLELDMGTMSHRRLKQKAAGYGDYARAEAWRDRHRFCPALLFLTTTGKRARSFLAAMERELGRDSLLLTCASDLARAPERCASERRWLLSVDGGDRPAGLSAALREARRPFKEAEAEAEAERRREEAERERLRSDPEALRSHLRRWGKSHWGTGRLDPAVATALEITLGRDEPMDEAERRAVLALGATIADPLRLWEGGRVPGEDECSAFEALVEDCGRRQLDHVDDLAGRLGDGPALREARGRIEGGELLGGGDLSGLNLGAAADHRARGEQERLHRDYLAWREGEARRRAKAQRLPARLRNGPETFIEAIDRRSLRVCPRCREIAYPDPERARYERATYDVAFGCHFCGASQLAEIDGLAGGRDRPR